MPPAGVNSSTPIRCKKERDKEREGEGRGVYLVWKLEIACARRKHTGPHLGVHDNETAAQCHAVFKLCAAQLVRRDASGGGKLVPTHPVRVRMEHEPEHRCIVAEEEL